MSSKKLKKKLNPTGLSRFLQVFNSASTPAPSTPKPINPSTATSVTAPSASAVEGGKEYFISTDRSWPEDEKAKEGPPKKRRTSPGLLGPGNEAHDATDLVPYYTSATEVPEHLQKCMHYLLSLLILRRPS